MFLSVTRLIRRWYIPRWYFTSPEPWWRGQQSHPRGMSGFWGMEGDRGVLTSRLEEGGIFCRYCHNTAGTHCRS